MKIVVDSSQFIDVSNVVAKSIQNKDVTEQTTTFKVENNKLIITNFSGTSLFKGAVNIVGLEDAIDVNEWVVSGVQFKIILSILQKSDEFVELHIKEGATQFTIISGTSKLKLPTSEVVSTIPEERIEMLGAVSAISFLDNLMNLTKITSPEEQAQGYSLSCIHLFGGDSMLTMMATNSIALTERKIPMEDSETDFTILIKNVQANLLQSSSFKADDVLTLYHTKNMFGYIDNNGVLCLVSKINLEPLKYDGFKDQVSEDQKVKVNSQQLKFAVDSVSKLCNNNSDIIIKVADNKLTAENANNDVIKIPKEGDVVDCRMTLNRQSFIALINILDEKVNLCWAEGDGRKIISVQTLDSDEEVDDNSFTIITTNDR